jgi:hypothetical protein
MHIPGRRALPGPALAGDLSLPVLRRPRQDAMANAATRVTATVQP